MQPKPNENLNDLIYELVIDDIKERAKVGKQKYGTYLQAFNGRDPTIDAYEEALDLAKYLKQLTIERAEMEKEIRVLKNQIDLLSNVLRRCGPVG